MEQKHRLMQHSHTTFAIIRGMHTLRINIFFLSIRCFGNAPINEEILVASGRCREQQ